MDTTEDVTPTSTLTPTPPTSHDPYAALRSPDFRLLITGRFITTLGEQMIAVALGWEIYDRTHSTLALGLVGLVLVFPVIVLSLPAGHLADRLNRKHIVTITTGGLAFFALGLALLSALHGPLWLVYACLLGVGIAGTFNSPASTTLTSMVIPVTDYANAATWNSSSWQLASVVGPALGGLLIAVLHGAAVVYGLYALAATTFIVLLARVHVTHVARPREPMTLGSLAAGASFVWKTKVILAAITLDLFAVLLGGATTLLPVYARDILHVDAAGLGWLRAAPAVGAVTMALTQAFLPPFRRAGRVLLFAVTGFGIATIIFGLSTSFWLSLAMLFILGALDNISVIIRSTLLLVRTPDAMRGRISAVNNLFIGMSNELGGFESGLAASLTNPVIAVVGGGIGTIFVVAAIALIWPEMRQLGRLNEQIAD